MSVAKYAFSSSAPSSEEEKSRQHSRKFDYPKATAEPEPDQWPLASGLIQRCLWPLTYLLGSIRVAMASQLNYINLNTKHLPSKYSSI